MFFIRVYFSFDTIVHFAEAVRIFHAAVPNKPLSFSVCTSARQRFLQAEFPYAGFRIFPVQNPFVS